MAAPMSHEEANSLLALDAIGALEPTDRDEMERHVSTCESCRHLAAQYADVASLLPAALDPVPPPARLRRNLLSQVYGEATSKGPAPWWRRLITAIPANRAITVVAGAAVAAVVAVAIWGMAGRGSAPAPVSYVVSGGTSQQSVTGTLAVDATRTQSILTVHGLAALPRTEVYEVWLIPAHGAPKGVAFLTPDPSAAAWTAVVNGSLTGYTTIAATNEPTGGSPGPTGSQVLIGQLGES
jgi:anti-sigma-K factor RskA